MSDIEQLINECLLNVMPEIMYHGCIGEVYNKDNFYNIITIFNDKNEYINYEKKHGYAKGELGKTQYLKTKGRPNLDAAFHGFYVTPNFREAKIMATKKINRGGQVLVFKVNKNDLLKLKGISPCVPNLDWGKFIVLNRKEDTTRNYYDYSYSLIADGSMVRLTPIIQNCKLPYISDFFQEMIPRDLKILFQGRDLSWNYEAMFHNS